MTVDIYNTDKKYNIIYADPPWSYNDKMHGHSFSLEHEYQTVANLGKWTMGNVELCLLGIKGKPNKFRIDKTVKQLVIAERTSHSKKPDEVRKRIVQGFGDIPRIELFARQYADGWDCWGNEV